MARTDNQLQHLGGAFVDAQRADLAVQAFNGQPVTTPRPPCSCTAPSITFCATSVA
jgi:hypothetical protein